MRLVADILWYSTIPLTIAAIIFDRRGGRWFPNMPLRRRNAMVANIFLAAIIAAVLQAVILRHYFLSEFFKNLIPLFLVVVPLSVVYWIKRNNRII